MFVDFLLQKFASVPEQTAIVWNHQSFSFAEISKRFQNWSADLVARNITPGSVVGLEGDFSPNTIALFLALVDRACIIVPKSNSSFKQREEKDLIAEIEFDYAVDEHDQVRFLAQERPVENQMLDMPTHQPRAKHELYLKLKERQHPGLVLFSSGTSGAPKAAVHDFTFLLDKFKSQRPEQVTLNFLLFDHWGGLNTMLHTLSTGGVTVTVRERTPEAVCQLVEKHKVTLLPATPTFLNLLLISGIYKNHDLSSLKVITYGAEPMLQSTLDKLNQVFPQVRLQQTYGLIEVGVLRSKSRENGSLWVKIGGDDYQLRIVDGILQIKTQSTILGYLNAPTPITEDGWYITGDMAEQDGEYFRIYGRKSELINVGGEKVYPAEVESVIQALDNVAQVTVYGEKNPLIGNIVCAKVKLIQPEKPSDFSMRLKIYCQSRLEKFKVPVKVVIDDSEHHGDRFKKARADIAKGVSATNV